MLVLPLWRINFFIFICSVLTQEQWQQRRRRQSRKSLESSGPKLLWIVHTHLPSISESNFNGVSSQMIARPSYCTTDSIHSTQSAYNIRQLGRSTSAGVVMKYTSTTCRTQICRTIRLCSFLFPELWLVLMEKHQSLQRDIRTTYSWWDSFFNYKQK